MARVFRSGPLVPVRLDQPGSVSPASPQRRVHSDAVARTDGVLVYAVNRFLGDNIQALDPASNYATRWQCSTGNGSNPHDIAFASATKAYVTLFGDKDLLIVNPAVGPDCTGFVRGSIGLFAFLSAD